MKELLERIEALEARLENFVPVAVDLRIDGVIRTVILFAVDTRPKPKQPTFTIVA